MKTADQPVERCLMIVVAERLERHTFELRAQSRALVSALCIDQFSDRATVADQRGDHAEPDFIGHA